jgi:hypothetical protein
VTITATLPGIQVDWTQWSQSGWTFVQYNVYRRRSTYNDPWGVAVAAGDWTRIAVITDVATIQYTDPHLVSARNYNYTVTVTANNGVDNIESAKQGAPPTDSVTYQDAFLHNTSDFDEYTPIEGQPPARFAPRQLVELRRARGRLTPTAFISELEATEVDWNIKPHLHTAKDTWNALKLLQTTQRETAAVLCMRSGTQEDLHFVQISDLSRSDDIGTYTIRLSLQEVFFDEAVS